MVYSRTPKTIQRVKPLLDQMVNADINLEWSVTTPKRTAYHIWQAIKFAIKSGKAEYKKYAVLSGKYKIKVIEPDTLKAELKSTPVINGTVIRDVTDVVEVVGIAYKLKFNNMIFPDVKPLSPQDTNILFNWCRGNDYSFRWNSKNQLQLIRYEDG